MAAAIIVAAAVISIVLTLWGGFFRRPTGGWKAPEISTPSFKFSDSWATSLTSIGALLGTVLGAGLLPDDPIVMSKNKLVGLNILFGLLVVIAPLFYNAFRVKKGSGAKPIYEGKLWAFWFACLLTLWAVAGEVLTILS